MTEKSRRFPNDFKDEALKLAEKIGVRKAAEELSILPDNIHRWRRNGYKKTTESASGLTPESPEAELRRLRKENIYLKRINEVLKKSTAIFSSDQIGGMR